MTYSYSVTVYRRNLQAQFQVGGQGYRWLDKVRLAMHRGCVREASEIRRTGVLAASHNSSIRGINQWACRAEVENTAEHALWVHQGTKGYIYPTDAEALWVPVAPYSNRRRWKDRVDGQTANPWMDRACTAVAIRNGAVPYS